MHRRQLDFRQEPKSALRGDVITCCIKTKRSTLCRLQHRAQKLAHRQAPKAPPPCLGAHHACHCTTVRSHAEVWSGERHQSRSSSQQAL
eukprot:1582936-Pleurochrysis_carterae.AAC.2